MIQRAFFGEKRTDLKIPDLRAREMTVMALMMAVIIWIGLYPQPLLDTAGQSLKDLRHNVYEKQGSENIPRVPAPENRP